MFPHICAQGLCIWPRQGQGHGGRCGEEGIQTHVGAGVSGGPGGSRLASGTRCPSCRIRVRVSGGPAPALTLSPRWPLLAAQGTSLLLEALGQTTPSSRSRPTSRVELCGDSARQPGRRPQRPVRPPRLGRTPSGPHPDTAQRRRHPPPPRRAKGSAAGPRGDSYSAGKRTSGALFAPCPP